MWQENTRGNEMSNPNNCGTCDHMKANGNREGHCYMFREEPTGVCMQHTGRKANALRVKSIFERAAEDVMAGYKTRR
jgi:hypothetical protein